jgi:hypothetical protein
MTGLARSLCNLAAWLLPARRKTWGNAMCEELAYIGAGREAIAHGFGCVAAAARERMLDFETRFAAGLWAAALVGAAFASIHLVCAAHGIAVLRGAPDGFLEALMRHGADAELVARYEAARPIVIACFFALGLSQLAGSWFLSRRRLRQFGFAWCAATLVAAVAVVIQLSVVWTPVGLPSEFVAVLIQALAVPLLLLWSNGRHLEGRKG